MVHDENYLLEKAILIAAQMHAGQCDKAGAPYILHPLRVMLRMRTGKEKVVGVLHDVLEDTPRTLTELAGEGFSTEVLDALDSLTRREGESYEEFILRAGANPIGKKVKLADLEDNIDMRRIENPGPEDLAHLVKYRKAWSQLTAGD